MACAPGAVHHGCSALAAAWPRGCVRPKEIEQYFIRNQQTNQDKTR